MINKSLKLTENAFQIDSDTEDLDEQETKMIKETTQQLCRSTWLKYLHRSQLVPFLKQKVLNSKISLQKDIEHVVKKYFTQKQNPLYKSNESLPQKIYVCGWCKEVLFYDFHYLIHCLNTKCPVNHPRSTYFFYHDDNMIKNQSIQAILEKKEFETLAKVEINKQNHFFSEYQIEKKYSKRKGQYYCGYCKLSYWKKNQQKFFNHCAYRLECRNHPLTTHIITLKQCLENTEEFVETILNFQLNYNLLTLFKNHYVRLGLNRNLNNSLACPNCMYVSPSQEYYLKHSIFQCTQKPNNQSSCPITLKKIKTMIAIRRENMKSGLKKQIVRKSTLKTGQLKAVRIIDQQDEYQTKKSQKIAVVKQQNQDESISSSSKSSIIDQLQVIQSLENIQNQDQFNIYDRILFPNIDYINQFSRYYCQKCNLSFKKDTLFMQHLVSCKSYENFNSSHFFTTCDRIQKIIEQISMRKNDWQEKEFLGNQYSDYSNQTHYHCGCGKVGLLKLFLDHVCRDHGLNIPSGSSHIIMRVSMFNYAKKRAIYLPVDLKNPNPDHSFHCPCNPSKIYRYKQFIDHVIQKHVGRTPICRMKKQN